MLDELRVYDYALVRDASLVFSEGLTVLTGETGAGKTALVGAIKLMIGERADVSAIRDGASELLVEGRLIEGEVEHIVTRRLSRDGRSRCLLNGSMVSVSTLAEKIGPLVDLHGQHEHQSLLSVATQLNYLDQYAGAEGALALARYQEARAVQLRALADLEELKQASTLSRQTLDDARFIVREIQAVAPQPHEYEELEQLLPVLRNGESLAIASQSALDALRSESGALDLLAEAHRYLAQEARVDPRLDDLAAQLESISISAEDLASSLRSYRESVEFDPGALDETLSRLSALDSLRKRYGPRMEDVFSTFDKAARQIELTEDLTERIDEARLLAASSEEELVSAASELASVREQAAVSLAAVLNSALVDFAMKGSSLEFTSQELPRQFWTEKGSVRYEVMYKPAEFSQPRPLAKIASGGELSRVMLALKCILRAAEQRSTLVFDEVDAGIGGNTATVVAERIRMLARDNQVIVVTHLAQIAALADTQFVVEKAITEGTATTEIREVRGKERIAEIARMLSGRTDDVALAHAQTLLESGGSSWQ